MTHSAFKIQQQQKREGDSIDGTIAAVIIIVIALTMLAVLAVPARASESWNPETAFGVQHLDSTQKFTYIGVLAVIDYWQTVNTVVRQPDRYRELNPVLGERPTRQSLALFGAVGISAVYALDKYLPETLARIVVDSIIMTEQVNVWENQYAIEGRKRMPVMIAVSYQF